MAEEQKPYSLTEAMEQVDDKPVLRFSGGSLTIFFRANLMDQISRDEFLHDAFRDEEIADSSPLQRRIGLLRVNQAEPFPDGPRATHIMMPLLFPRLVGQLEECQRDLGLSELEFGLVQYAIDGLRNIIEAKPKQ